MSTKAPDTTGDDNDDVVAPPSTKKQKKDDDGSSSFAKIAQKEFSLKEIDKPQGDNEDCWKEYLTFRRSLEKQKTQYKKEADDSENENSDEVEAWDKLYYDVKSEDTYPTEWKDSIYFHINDLSMEDGTIRTIEVETTLFSTDAVPHAVITKTYYHSRPHASYLEHNHNISYKYKNFTSVDKFMEFQKLAKFSLNPIELDDDQFSKSTINGMVQHLIPNQNKKEIDNDMKLMLGKLLLTASLCHDEKGMEYDEDGMKRAGMMMAKPSDMPYRMGWVEHRLAYATGTEKPYHKFFKIPQLQQAGRQNGNDGEDDDYQNDQDEGYYVSESEKYLQK